MDLHCAAAELLSVLPSGDGLSVEEQARAVLRVLLERVVSSGDATPVQVEFSLCPNCDGPFSSNRSPYCSTECRELSGFVRQFREGLAQGTILSNPERQIAFGQLLWNLLGGGLPLRNSMIPEKTRIRNIAKAGGICCVCGAEGTTFDHRGSFCNRGSNLLVKCESCAETRPFGDPSVVNSV